MSCLTMKTAGYSRYVTSFFVYSEMSSKSNKIYYVELNKTAYILIQHLFHYINRVHDDNAIRHNSV